ncbi:MAG: Rpn family recombination-promoting nuclease/putative transposase [Lachnospiraceae bacterium]|nr:Rpn family recombination-promoting nuclease/putative transposase [Lachnospiraceae bacterium]
MQKDIEIGNEEKSSCKKRKAWKGKQGRRNKLITNTKVRDSGSKVIFDEPVLCAQFLRDYVDLPYMKDIQPEDIRDVSSQFVPMFAEERNADRVKRIDINGTNPFFLVSLIEHKTDIEYDVCMQIFRYMIYIWEAYAKEEEQKQEGVSKQKDFKYPPVLPIVYYEGSKKWTAPLDFKSRVNQGDVFVKYIPDFQYYLVPLRNFTNDEHLGRGDEMSVVMLFNKLQTKDDVEAFRKIAPERLEEILRETPSICWMLWRRYCLHFC